MYRILMVSWCLVLCVGLVPGSALAEYRFHDGSEMEIQWYEKEGLILPEKVCFNYKKSRSQYRQCRRKAVDYFEQECEFYTEKIRTTHQKYRAMYKPEKDKFCTASDVYEP